MPPFDPVRGRHPQETLRELHPCPRPGSWSRMSRMFRSTVSRNTDPGERMADKQDRSPSAFALLRALPPSHQLAVVYHWMLQHPRGEPAPRSSLQYCLPTGYLPSKRRKREAAHLLVGERVLLVSCAITRSQQLTSQNSSNSHGGYRLGYGH